MQTYPIPMVPGPVRVPEAILKAHQTDFGAPALESEFFALYQRAETALQTLLGTQNSVAILTGEGMLALWGALKSCLKPGDRVLSVATGVFGYGIGEMAKTLGADVRTIGLGYDETIGQPCLEEVETALKAGDYKMITAVHCETPSGTLNPLDGLGALKRKYGVPLFYADVVSSVGGAPVLADEWGIDLALGGSQKCLSMPPSLSSSPSATPPGRPWNRWDTRDTTPCCRSGRPWKTAGFPLRPTGTASPPWSRRRNPFFPRAWRPPFTATKKRRSSAAKA